MKKILIIEDDFSIREELKELLNSAHYDAYSIFNFENPLDQILELSPDLILLDIQIPNINGEILLKELRTVSNIPVIMVTSKNSETDEVLSMSYGADDYIVKPYNPTLLLLRIGAVLKRLEGTSDTITYHDMKLVVGKGIIKRGETEILLTKNEMIILSFLLNHRGTIVTRDEIMMDLWNNSEYINDNTLSVNISRLRQKLKEIGYEDAIETRKGQGYILV